MGEVLLDAAGRRRSPATMPGFHAGRPQRNKGRRYPADPPTIEEIVAVDDHLRAQRRLLKLDGDARELQMMIWMCGGVTSCSAPARAARASGPHRRRDVRARRRA